MSLAIPSLVAKAASFVNSVVCLHFAEHADIFVAIKPGEMTLAPDFLSA